MNYAIYVWKRPNEARLYMSQQRPEPDRHKRLQQEGFRIYAVSIDVSDEEQVHYDGATRVKAEGIESSVARGMGRIEVVSSVDFGVIVEENEDEIVIEWESHGGRGTFGRKQFEQKFKEGIFRWRE